MDLAYPIGIFLLLASPLVLVSVKITSLVLRLDGSETAPNRPFPVLKSA